MEPITTILATAAGYILKGAADSKTAGTAREQVLGTFWKWVRPKFIHAVPDIEKDPDDPGVAVKTQEHLLELVKDEGFFRELEERVVMLQKAGVTEKNIVKGYLNSVKRIRIGDKLYAPGESYGRKNIVEGDVSDADEFVLGDGH